MAKEGLFALGLAVGVAVQLPERSSNQAKRDLTLLASTSPERAQAGTGKGGYGSVVEGW